MGIYDRDYIRDQPQSGIFGGGMTPVVKYLLVINVTVFLIQLFSTGQTESKSALDTWLALNTDKVLGGQVWRIITHAFCHDVGSFFHIVFNMFGLFMFGREMERKYGSREFLGFYLVAILVSAVFYMAIGELVPPEIFVLPNGQEIETIRYGLGASGAVIGVLVLYGINYPKREILLWFVLRVQIRWVIVAIIVLDLVPALFALAGKSLDTGVAHTAHLGGVAFAFAYWKSGVRLRKLIPGGNRTGSSGKGNPKPKKSKLTTDGRSKAEIDKQVDELLQKISDYGIHSLTDKERKFLDKASGKFG